jgi:hypothetical protein
MPDRRKVSAPEDEQAGSLLVEVLAALAMGAVLVNSIHGFHAAAIEAAERSSDRRLATWAAVADVELAAVSGVRLEQLAVPGDGGTGEDAAAGDGTEDGPGVDDVTWLVRTTSPGRVVVLRRDEQAASSVTSGACATPAGAGSVVHRTTEAEVARRHEVDRGGAARTSPSVTLQGRLRGAPHEGTRRIERHVVDATGAPLAGVELRAVGPAPSTTSRVAVTDASGCAVIGDLVAGEYDVSLTATGLVDTAHVPVTMRAPTLIGLGDADDVAVERIAPGTVVTVDVGVPPGARTPDLLSIPSLRWSVHDDDQRIATSPGEARILHPGPRTLVLGTCGAAAAGGSRRRVDLVPGATDRIVVGLAVLRLEGTAGYADATIHVQRAAPCLDGTTLRPWMRWTGAITEGVELALPADAWTLEVRSSSGQRLLGPLGVQTGTAPVVLRLNP